MAEAVDLPVVLYNVPGRTVADMQPETALRLAQVPGIVGIKEATGNIERACWLIKQAPAGFSIYSGDDGTAVALMLLGGHGNVSVTANVAPRLMHELCMAAIEGDVKRATALHLRLLPLHKQLFCEPSPAPTKWALAQLGRCGRARAPAHPAAHRRRPGPGRPGAARQRPAGLSHPVPALPCSLARPQRGRGGDIRT